MFAAARSGATLLRAQATLGTPARVVARAASSAASRPAPTRPVSALAARSPAALASPASAAWARASAHRAAFSAAVGGGDRPSYIGGTYDTPSTESVRKLLQDNRKWAKNMSSSDPEFFERHLHGQSPEYLFIGCADSRKPPDVIAGVGPGRMFVTRNVANLVVSTDMSMLSVLQYAVEVLKVPDIIVCGHYNCGGVQQAMKTEDAGPLENWLRNIRDVYRLHRDELDAIEDEEARFRRLVEVNVAEQCFNLFKTGIVQRAQRETRLPRIHGLVYDFRDGLLRKLQIDFKEYARQNGHIYSLYED